MAVDRLQEEIDAYLEARWEQVVADIDALVRIPSTEDMAAAQPGAPFGLGPHAALDEVLAIAAREGLDAHDCEGYIGYADLPGTTPVQVGIIGHVDVVPEGPGWTFDPFRVQRKDGYLVGRGVADDKGPLVVALHAVAFWREKLARESRRFPYTIRLLFGANEETEMRDVDYYRARFADPAFLFTPDAEFPVGYGEAGICHGVLRSAPIVDGKLMQLEAGVAPNAVPGTARAVVRCDPAALPAEENITVTRADAASMADAAAADSAIDAASMADAAAAGDAIDAAAPAATSMAIIEAKGRSAHASTPELGDNALARLVDYLLAADVCTYHEQQFLKLQRAILRTTDGSGVGAEARDEHFGALTLAGTMARVDGDVIEQTIDCRYPTTTTSAQVAGKIATLANLIDATFEIQHDKAPFLMKPDSPAVQALLAAYNQATGERAVPFTMKGGTYARAFTTGVSFGPDKPWEAKPAWVGGMHGADEGISEALLKQAFSIYVRTIANLMELDLVGL